MKDYLVIVRLINGPGAQVRKQVRVMAPSVADARRAALKECADAGLRVRDILAAGLV